MLKSRKGIYRKTRRSKRVICNRTKSNRTKGSRTKSNRTKGSRIRGGNYDTDVTTQTKELVPMKSKGVVVAMPGYVLSAEEYQDHMEYMDRQGQP